MLTALCPPYTTARMLTAVLLVSALALAAPGAGVAHAATLTVTTTADSGPGSLRQAIADAAPGDTITFAVTGTIVVTDVLEFDKNLTISGPGASQLAISGGGATRVFLIGHGMVTIQGLTIRDGYTLGAGGAIKVYSGSIGGVPTTLTVNDVTFIKNVGVDDGGAISAHDSDVRINNSTFRENAAQEGGAIFMDGNLPEGFGTPGRLRVDSSTFDRNSATFAGGAILTSSAVPTVGTTVINSTFTGNLDALGGGGIVNSWGTLRVANSTFTENASSSPDYPGAGILNVDALYVKNTLFANSPSGLNCLNYGSLTMAGVNLSTDDSCGFTQVSSDALQLGPLASNGGPTMTHALLEGSVAIDAGVDCTDWFGQPVTTDQRGVTRPQGLACDVGAFEREANAFTFSGFFAPVDNLPTINLLKAGSAVPLTFSLGGDHGLNILATGSPQAPAVACTPGVPTDSVIDVVTAGNSSLSYDPTTMTYTYVWKTEKAWANTCRELQVTLIDGTVHKARFQFGR